MLASGRVLRSEHLTLSFSANALPTARLGLVIGRRAVRLAVGRNLAKRVAREAFRVVRPYLPTVDLVLRISKPLGVVERAKLRREIDGLLARLAA